MDPKDWVLRHSDAWHPGSRENCEHCRQMIEAFGEMPPAEDIIAAAYRDLLVKGKAYIPPCIRWEVWERDDFRCKQCGSRRNLSVDHIKSESQGGTLDLENLQTLCLHCNCKKGAR